MRVPLLSRSEAQPGQRCIVCHREIRNDPEVRIRGMHMHHRCATYKLRTAPRRRW